LAEVPREVIEIVREAFEMVRMKLEVVRVAVEESVTETVKVEVPTIEGVPEMTPVEELIVRPAGSVPLATAKVFPPDPPELEIVSGVNGELKVPVSPLVGVAIERVELQSAKSVKLELRPCA
jgi:hypothetical protein